MINRMILNPVRGDTTCNLCSVNQGKDELCDYCFFEKLEKAWNGNMTKHDSMRGWFAYELYQHMKKNKDIILLTGDLGYGMFDSIRDEMPKQFINCGAAEQAMMGIAVGLALEGKIPFVYSITTFLLYRPFETIRNYVDNEEIPVRLIGSGRDKDYKHDGFSHDSSDAEGFLYHFNNIRRYWPETKEEIPHIVSDMIKSDRPSFLSLRR